MLIRMLPTEFLEWAVSWRVFVTSVTSGPGPWRGNWQMQIISIAECRTALRCLSFFRLS